MAPQHDWPEGHPVSRQFLLTPASALGGQHEPHPTGTQLSVLGQHSVPDGHARPAHVTGGGPASGGGGGGMQHDRHASGWHVPSNEQHEDPAGQATPRQKSGGGRQHESHPIGVHVVV